MQVKIRTDKDTCEQLVKEESSFKDSRTGKTSDLEFGLFEAAAVAGIVSTLAVLADIIYRTLKARKAQIESLAHDENKEKIIKQSDYSEIIITMKIQINFSQETIHFKTDMTKDEILALCKQVEK